MFEQHASDVELPDDLRRAVEDELDRDERLYWTAQPIPGRLAMKTLPIMLFAIPWTGFAVFWMAAASGFGQEGLDGPGMCFTLFGLPFVLIGLGMFSAPYWVYRKAGRSAYAITDRRAILLDAGWFGGLNVRSFGP
ncbi:MAG: hypothetical protein GX591_16930, partial [Planctomycetes bacterium]|nr:hypothetical protein [Planctomycetota bacterium]